MPNETPPTGRAPKRELIQLQPSETAILEMVPDALVISNSAGTIVFVNQQAESIFGCLRNELLEKGLETLVPARFHKRHRSRRIGFFAKPESRPMGSRQEIYGIKKDGTEFPAEISLSPFQTTGGMLAIAVIRDISELKQVTEALHEKVRELADFKAALDEHAILAITNPSGVITYVNDKFCTISKYSREELLGQDHRIINSGYHSAEFWAHVWATIGKGEVWKGEVRNRAKDGSFYWVDATIVPFLDDDGKPVQYVAIRTEISARKKGEEERENLIVALQGVLAEVKTLSGLLPICCNCKKVRDDRGYWNQIEAYIGKHSNAQFSHGYCPDCIGQVYKDAGLPAPHKSQRK